MPCGLPSSASASVRPTTACFDVAYAPKPLKRCMPRKPPSDETLTMSPCMPASRHWRMTARQALNVPPTLIAITSAKRAGVSSSQRSEEHTSELQSLMRISYAVFCLKKKHHQQKDLTT